MSKTTGETRESLGTVARVVALLRAIAEHDNALTLTTLSEKMGLAPSTTHRLVSLVTQEGLVERNPVTKTYACGAEFLRIASLVVGASSLVERAEPMLRKLAAQYDETSMLCLYLARQQRYTIAKAVHGTQLLRYDIRENTPLSLAWGASARSILAFLPQPVIDAVLEQDAVGAQAVEQPADILQDLQVTRQRGYAYTKGQRVAGSVGLGAPVFGAGGQVVGSLCLTIPDSRFDAAKASALGQALIRQAGELSRLLGHRAP